MGKKSAAWWARLARPLVREYEPGLVALARALPRRRARARAWSHTALSRFVATGTCSADLALAISAFFKLPRPAFVARSMKEAFEIEAICARYDNEPPPNGGVEAEIIVLEEKLAELRRAQITVVRGEAVTTRTARRR